MGTYVERQSEERVETGQKNKQSRDEIINGRCASIGRQIERNDVDYGRKSPTDILPNSNDIHNNRCSWL